MLLLAPALLCGQGTAKPERIKAVVVTMFERGADTGDEPGEFQFWVERERLTKVYDNPGGRNYRGNGQGLLALVTGVGTARAAASVLHLGHDPRFDLLEAYWLVAGIAGIDPEDASAGSAAWADWVVDSDLSFEIDSREAPADWPDGLRPLSSGRGLAFQLDRKLVDWAWNLTKGLRLPDTPNLQRARAGYSRYPNAIKPPFVLRGDSISGGRFWHGVRMNAWANRFMAEMTGGKGRFVTTAMEDSGTLEALRLLGAAGKVDPKRVLVLRTGSNYSLPPDGMTAAESLMGHAPGKYSAYLESLDAAHRAGSVVVKEWLK
jgi:purine nucleoside permease